MLFIKSGQINVNTDNLMFHLNDDGYKLGIGQDNHYALGYGIYGKIIKHLLSFC
jgi:hypothetical protein